MIETKSGTVNQSSLSLRDRLKDALMKDSGPLGDITSNALIESEKQSSAELVVKSEKGIVSGIEVVKQVFEIIDPEIKFTPLLADGDTVTKGDRIALIEGNGRNILTGERVALEFIRRMSGIATKTALFVKAIENTGTVILDTRKILPGYGELDKQAVRDGGGVNHRSNLSEMGLIKNNHLDIVGDISWASAKFREAYPDIPLEIEVRNLDEFLTALINEPDRILLDNMSNDRMKEAVWIRNEFQKRTEIRIPLEASGNITLDRVKAVAETGVDYISVGALTHSVDAFDISLHITFEK